MIDLPATLGVDTLLEYVRSQLPRAIANNFEIELVADPYLLKVVATFYSRTTSASYQTVLLQGEFGTLSLSCRLSDTALAQLCVIA